MHEHSKSADRQSRQGADRCQSSSRDIDRLEVESYLASQEFQRLPPSLCKTRQTRQAWPNRDISPATSFSMAMVGFRCFFY